MDKKIAHSEDLVNVNFEQNLTRLIRVINNRIAQDRMEEAKTLIDAFDIIAYPFYIGIDGKVYEGMRE